MLDAQSITVNQTEILLRLPVFCLLGNTFPLVNLSPYDPIYNTQCVHIITNSQLNLN